MVITTKTGKIGAPRLEYRAYIGEEMPRHLPKMITPQEQANAQYASYLNSTPSQTPQPTSLLGTGNTPVLPDYIIQGGTANLGVAAGDPRANPSLYNFNNYRILKANQAGTNWWTTIFKPAMTQNHQLAISGANDRSNYAVTFGYMNDNGTLLNSYFKRPTFRFGSIRNSR